MVLKAYLDGGNKADSAQYDVVSLAALMGSPGLWKDFERDWKRTLKKHGAAYLHTTDAIARKGIYKGWAVEKRDAFLTDLAQVSGRHGARVNTPDKPGKYGILCYVISIVLSDFIDCAKNNPIASKNADEACMREALGEVLMWSENQAACKECHLFFDRGEPYHGHIVQLLQNKNAKKAKTLLPKVTSTTEVDSRRTPAMQCADFYAWCQSHRNSTWKPKWKTKMLNTHFRWVWIDKTNVNDINVRHQMEFLSWNMPKRTPTK